jgi:hypothetical protein
MQKEFKYFLKHSKELIKKHAGRYVAVIKNNAIAFGKNQYEAYKKAKKNHPHDKIFIFYLPTKKELLTALTSYEI